MLSALSASLLSFECLSGIKSVHNDVVGTKHMIALMVVNDVTSTKCKMHFECKT